jgi:hypothetical protein
LLFPTVTISEKDGRSCCTIVSSLNSNIMRADEQRARLLVLFFILSLIS